MGRTAIVIVDVQVNMFGDDFCVYDGRGVLRRIVVLAQAARDAGAPVIYVRNNGGEGQPDEPRTRGWEFHPQVSPIPGEVIIDKSGPDAFEGTQLREYLDEQEIDHLVVTGMQTELCIDATSRRAHELGYGVTVVQDAHTTFDFGDRTAAQAIADLNQELRTIVDVKPAEQVRFADSGASA
jgi:nicotinamidase-related amidase